MFAHPGSKEKASEMTLKLLKLKLTEGFGPLFIMKILFTLIILLTGLLIPKKVTQSHLPAYRVQEYVDNVEPMVSPEYLHITDVHVTMYHPLAGQTDSTPDIVADGSWFDINTASDLKWLAVSRDLLDRWGGPLSFGDIVYIEIKEESDKSGFYKVKDTMNPRFTKRIDILETPGYPLYRHPSASMYLVFKEDTPKEDLWSLQEQNKLVPL
jgi:hypothetical protein